jgi:hypothetical protein
MEVSGQLHSPATLLPVAIEYEGRWAADVVWTQRPREKNVHHCLRRELNPARPDHILVSVLTELSVYFIPEQESFHENITCLM